MKTIKFILSAILMMMAFTIQAQTIQVYKDGVVVKEYPASEVKSVEVKPVYYYYAGWECPKNEEELAELVANADGTNAIGGTTTKLTGYSSTNTLLNIVTDIINPNGIQLDPYYIVVPNGINIYDVTLPNVPLNNTSFEDYTSIKIDNYKIYKSRDGQYNVSGIQLY